MTVLEFLKSIRKIPSWDRTPAISDENLEDLINQGYSKKNAKWLAWYCCGRRIPYGKAYSLIILGLSVR